VKVSQFGQFQKRWKFLQVQLQKTSKRYDKTGSHDDRQRKGRVTFDAEDTFSSYQQ
jgi:hypothetical protein